MFNVETMKRTMAHHMSAASDPDLTLDASVRHVAERIRAEIASGNEAIMTQEALEDMLGTLLALYAGHVEKTEVLVPIRLGEHVSATTVLMATSALLRGANLELFELGMWQSWSGMK
jgi:hypothetical protein